MAEGMRSTSARDAFSFGYFSLGLQRKVTRQQGEITLQVCVKIKNGNLVDNVNIISRFLAADTCAGFYIANCISMNWPFHDHALAGTLQCGVE